LEPSEAELHAPEQSRQESPFVDIMDAIAQTTPPI
jgi:hypothetical protein